MAKQGHSATYLSTRSHGSFNLTQQPPSREGQLMGQEAKKKADREATKCFIYSEDAHDSH